MTFQTSADADASISPVRTGPNESPFSGVSWGAIIVGSVIAAAMALILSSLGAGLGLLALSPWKVNESRFAAVGIGTIIWSVIVEVVAFGLGGYLAGRLRTKWAKLHSDEVFFRDTAHGFAVWALGTLVSACLITSAIGAVGSGVASAGASAAGAATAAGVSVASMSQERGGEADDQRGQIGYFADMMLRPSPGGAGTATSPSPGNAATQTGDDRREISRIMIRSVTSGSVNDQDKSYLAQVVAQRTGMSQADAQKRVDDVMGQLHAAVESGKQKAKEAADVARKTLAGVALWGFISMLIGAFSASFAASCGGRARDRY